MEQRTIEAHALTVVVDERIAELWAYRRWVRHQPNAAFWSPLRVEYELELRALLRLRRKARALAAPAIPDVYDAEGTLIPRGEYPDPEVLSYHDWQTAS